MDQLLADVLDVLLLRVLNLLFKLLVLVLQLNDLLLQILQV